MIPMFSYKFGGTSMGSAENITQVADILTRNTEVKSVVVSAMSGITDLLISAGAHAKAGKMEDVQKILDTIKEKHFFALQNLINDAERQALTRGFIETQIQKLYEFLEAIAIIQEISPRSHDQIVALGEILSAYLLSAHLQDRGFQSEFVNLEDIVPSGIKVVNRKFFEKVQEALKNRIEPLLLEGKIPVITGFFGRIPGGIVGAVGRGYSDFTASLVGSACNAEEIQIWTDVNGILSADPRLVSDAISLEILSFEEASELANFGAKVIHPQTIWPAVQHNIPVRIKNTMNPENPGTAITANGKKTNRPFKSVTAKKSITVLTMHSFEMAGHGFMDKIFKIFSDYEISIDLISTSEASVSVTVNGNNPSLEKVIQELSPFCRVEEERKKAILAVIGTEMTGVPGIAGRIFTALGNANINLKMISQGATELNISAVIDEENVKIALEAIHKELL